MPEDVPTNGDVTYRVTATELRGFCTRIETLKGERAETNAQIREVKAEAKARGYDLKALDEILKLRALDTATRNEREALRELYGEALEIFS